ncbi:MAG: carboxypeptidase regulatory-like domain-containing protein [Vicinamibacterales bacterium]
MSTVLARLALATALLAINAWLSPTVASAQGVTTGAMSGLVTNADGQAVPGASVIAIHEPSGTVYEATTRQDGRFSILGMRVGGPYTVTVNFVGTGTAFEPQTVTDLAVTLGTATDVPVQVRTIAVQEQVTVTGTAADAVFSSQRTGAATAVTRFDIATLPTISGRISDITRLTPQASGNSFAGQDNRLNNITVDGSFFNNSFGLGAQPGDRTGVAPISLEAIEQVQVSIAPFDVRQGSFIGAAINTVTRSGTNELTASVYHRMRNEGFVGTEAGDRTVDPGEFTFRDTGFWAGGPIVRNRLFVFGNYENEEEKRPLIEIRPNAGGEAVGGNVSRVLASDLTALSSFLSQNFNYETGAFGAFDDVTPVKRYLLRTDFNLNNANKISFRYNQLDSSSDNLTSTSSSAGLGGRSFNPTGGLTFEGSTYSVLENIKSGIGEWNAVIGSTMSNNLIIGFTSNDESRGDIGELFPFVDVRQGSSAYASFGSEPFTVQNELRYKTFQLQDSFTRFGNQHTMTFGFSAQRYTSDNVFWSCCPQSNYVYASLADFYADAEGYLANPNRTTATVAPLFFKVRYSNVPDLDKPLQPLQVWYNSVYAQDEWRPRRDLTITAGVRADMSIFKNTAYRNEKADALTFLDPSDSPVQFQSGEMPESKVLWSPRAAANWDLGGRGTTQLRVGTGLFTGPPLYVWISNQLGNTGVLIGEVSCNAASCDTSQFGFNPNPDAYKPTNVTGTGAASYELDVTERDFKFPQVWRTNLGIDQRLPGGITGTLEFLFNKDVNGYAYYNANLPVPQSAITGVNARPRYTSNRLNTTPGNTVTNAFVLTNQDEGKSWNISASLSKNNIIDGLTIRGAYSYGEAKNTIDPGSTAFSSFNNNQHTGDPNNPGLGWSGGTQGHRIYWQATYSKEYFGIGATTISAFWEARPSTQNFTTRGSYTFGGDINGDGGSNNDLIYVPRDTSEMNFVAFTAGGRTFTAAEQATAFEAYIQQDPYLKTRRGQFAERGGLAMPIAKKMDLSVVQEIFQNIGGKRNAGEIRLDITNFGNLLNSSWGVGNRTVIGSTGANSVPVLTNATVNAQGQVSYRMAVVNNELVTKTFQKSAFLSDVYQVMLSFRYRFN